MRDTPYGYCHCGCGERTKLAPRTNRTKGWVEGEPLRYIRFHRVRDHDLSYTVDEESGCWVSDYRQNGRGYVQLTRKGRRVSHHRFMYELTVGPIPEGLDLDHLCRNRACVNPDHLEPVTPLENHHRGLLTKLTDEDVRSIIVSDLHIRTLAELFGVTPNYIYALRRGNRRSRRVFAEWPRG